MKKVVALLIIAIFFFTCAANADDLAAGPVKKLGRGIGNIFASPFYFIKGMGDTVEKNGWLAGMTWGVLNGTVEVVKRVSVGAYEVVTFPVPIPGEYKPILENPEFFTFKLDKRLSVYRTDN